MHIKKQVDHQTTCAPRALALALHSASLALALASLALHLPLALDLHLACGFATNGAGKDKQPQHRCAASILQMYEPQMSTERSTSSMGVANSGMGWLRASSLSPARKRWMWAAATLPSLVASTVVWATPIYFGRHQSNATQRIAIQVVNPKVKV